MLQPLDGVAQIQRRLAVAEARIAELETPLAARVGEGVSARSRRLLGGRAVLRRRR